MIVILHAIFNRIFFYFKKTKFTAELQLLMFWMCIQNAHECDSFEVLTRKFEIQPHYHKFWYRLGTIIVTTQAKIGQSKTKNKQKIQISFI